MSEFIAFRAANWARRKGREAFSLPSCVAAHCGARVALQQLPYPPSEQEYFITANKRTISWVTFPFEATLHRKLPFILRHYAP